MNKEFIEHCIKQIQENNKFINDINIYIKEVSLVNAKNPSKAKSCCITKLQEATMWLKADNEILEISIKHDR